jgi:hypothetical protein
LGIRRLAGVLLGGIVGDKIGRYNIIWISILGPLPLTLLLPHVDFFWTGVSRFIDGDFMVMTRT